MHAEERGARANGDGASGRRGVPLHTKILLGLGLGAAAGEVDSAGAGETGNSYSLSPENSTGTRAVFL